MEFTTTISSKGQITVPARIRRALHINPGDRLTVNRKGQTITVKPDSYEEKLAELRNELKQHLKKKGFTDEKLRNMAEEYQNGNGWSAYVEEKYGGGHPL
jgi:AbrB family looped-hinge helix DNA binding protein